MAEGRQQMEWNVAISVMANARLCMDNPNRVTVLDLVPEPYQPRPVERVKTPEEIEAENKAAWSLMARSMFGPGAGVSRVEDDLSS